MHAPGGVCLIRASTPIPNEKLGCSLKSFAAPLSGFNAQEFSVKPTCSLDLPGKHRLVRRRAGFESRSRTAAAVRDHEFKGAAPAWSLKKKCGLAKPPRRQPDQSAFRGLRPVAWTEHTARSNCFAKNSCLPFLQELNQTEPVD